MLVRPVQQQARALVSLIITGGGSAPGLLELRCRDAATSAWSQHFHPTTEVVDLPDGASHDVYAGCLPRLRPSGRRDAVGPGAVVWADCDDEASVAALAEFGVPPSLVVASGSAGHRHAYWRLPHPLPPLAIERANRRLALTLGSDAAVAHANAIMRLPGTLNHKADPPRPVAMVAQRPGAVELDVLLSACRELPARRTAPTQATATSPLSAVPPGEYVRVLLGVEVPPSRKVRCPGSHEDRTPSLHVYPTAQRGWFCFGCGSGGTIYHLAGLVFGLPTRGEGFLEIDRRLRTLWGCGR